MLVRFLRTGGIGMLKMMNQPEMQPEVPAQEHRT